jgi:hypothetical protein
LDVFKALLTFCLIRNKVGKFRCFKSRDFFSAKKLSSDFSVKLRIVRGNKAGDNRPKDSSPKDNSSKDKLPKDNLPKGNLPKGNLPKDNSPKDNLL